LERHPAPPSERSTRIHTSSSQNPSNVVTGLLGNNVALRQPHYGLFRLLQNNVATRLLCNNVATRLLGSSRVATLLPQNILSPTDYNPMHGGNVVDRLLYNNVVDRLLYSNVVHRLLFSNVADQLLPTGRGVRPRAHFLSTHFLKNRTLSQIKCLFIIIPSIVRNPSPFCQDSFHQRVINVEPHFAPLRSRCHNRRFSPLHEVGHVLVVLKHEEGCA